MNAESFRILHLSDLHFGTKFFLRDEKSCNDPKEWATKLADSLEKGLELAGVRDPLRETRGAKQFNLLVVSGDFTCNSQSEGMRAAEFFLDDIQGKGGHRGRWWASNDLLLIPGNHDMIFGKKPDNIQVPNLLVNLPRAERTADYRSMYRNVTGIPLKTPEWLGILKLYKRHRLAILGLDSCRLESWTAPGVGFVGCDQLKRLGDAALLAETEMGSGPWHRLAFLHHHVTGMSIGGAAAMREFQTNRHLTLTYDAEEIVENLEKYGVDFILHGHFHQPKMRSKKNATTQYGRVLSAGSAGIEGRLCSDLHQFYVLDIGYGAAQSNSKAPYPARHLEVRSFERPLNKSQEEWREHERRSFSLTESPNVIMEPEAVVELSFQAHQAQAAVNSYEGWPLAVRILTMQDQPDHPFHLKKLWDAFEPDWKRKQQYASLPDVLKAFTLLVRRIYSKGAAQFLEEFREELDTETGQTLSGFLAEKIADDPELWKGI